MTESGQVASEIVEKRNRAINGWEVGVGKQGDSHADTVWADRYGGGPDQVWTRSETKPRPVSSSK